MAKPIERPSLRPHSNRKPDVVRSRAQTSDDSEVWVSRAQRMRNNQNEEIEMSGGHGEFQQDISVEIKYRIGIVLGVIFGGIATLLEVLELIADIFSAGAAGTIVDIVQTLFFIPAFWLIGAPFWKGQKAAKKMTTFIVTTLVSYVPYISSVLPEILIGVIITIYLTRQEDREIAKKSITTQSSNITRPKRERQKIRRV